MLTATDIDARGRIITDISPTPRRLISGLMHARMRASLLRAVVVEIVKKTYAD